MADLKARMATVAFRNGKGGTVTSTRGLLEYVLGVQFNQWDNPAQGGVGASGRRRRKYGCRQRSLARSGKPCVFYLNNGEAYTARFTGADIDVIDFLAPKMGDRVIRICTPRGTTYQKQFSDVVI